MKLLLFDQNLSPKLVPRLEDLYPGSTHVSEIDLARALDEDIWEYASQHNYTIVTKDVDFNELSVMRGFPPKVVWIRRGNCSTRAIETILRESYDIIDEFSQDASLGVITLY